MNGVIISGFKILGEASKIYKGKGANTEYILMSQGC